MEKNTLAEKIRELGEASKYVQQGREFLEATATSMQVLEAVPQKAPAWEDTSEAMRKLKAKAKPIHYAITLKNARGSYTFDFWGSIRDAEMVALAKEADQHGNSQSPAYFAVLDFLKSKGSEIVSPIMAVRSGKLEGKVRELVQPNEYTVLACLHDYTGDSFEDFCANYGYDADSRRAEAVYKAVCEQERNMRRLFTHEELEALAEIN